jgi:cytochrome bd-type quinol oxidase subunit 2
MPLVFLSSTLWVKNKFMKKISCLSIFLIIIGLSLFSLVPARAAGLGDAFSSSNLAPVANGYDTSGNTDIYQIIGTVVNSILGLLGVIFIVLIVYAGIQWMTAEGDEAKVEKAQTTMRNAIIGLIIIVAAYAISFFIITFFNKAK